MSYACGYQDSFFGLKALQSPTKEDCRRVTSYGYQHNYFFETHQNLHSIIICPRIAINTYFFLVTYLFYLLCKSRFNIFAFLFWKMAYILSFCKKWAVFNYISLTWWFIPRRDVCLQTPVGVPLFLLMFYPPKATEGGPIVFTYILFSVRKRILDLSFQVR